MNDTMMRSMDLVHSMNMKLLLEIDRVCSKNNIQYFLDSGTLLGAVRGKDFIPWDDDVDIALKREDFEKLIAVKNDLSEQYKMTEPESHLDYFFDPITKISYKHSQLHNTSEADLYYHSLNNRLNVDLFPLDHLGKGFKGKLQIFQLKFLYGLAMSKRFKIEFNTYKGIEKTVVFVLSTIGRLIPLTHLLKRYKSVSTKYNSIPTDYYFSSYTILSELGRPISTKWYDKTETVYIQEYPFPGPIGWDQMMTLLYGDYHQVPPEEEQKPQHIDVDQVKVW